MNHAPLIAIPESRRPIYAEPVGRAPRRSGVRARFVILAGVAVLTVAASSFLGRGSSTPTAPSSSTAGTAGIDAPLSNATASDIDIRAAIARGNRVAPAARAAARSGAPVSAQSTSSAGRVGQAALVTSDGKTINLLTPINLTTSPLNTATDRSSGY